MESHDLIGKNHYLHCRADSYSLVKISFINFLLTLVTLGIYSFWAKIKVRQYIVNNIELVGRNFSFRASGFRLFLAALVFLLISFIVFGVFFWVSYLFSSNFIINILAWLLFDIFIVFLFFLMVFRSFRYRMQRTFWCGVNFCVKGGFGFIFAVQSMVLLVVSILTLGVLLPYLHEHIAAFKINNSRYGDGKFLFRSKDLSPLLIANFFSLVVIFLVFLVGFFIFPIVLMALMPLINLIANSISVIVAFIITVVILFLLAGLVIALIVYLRCIYVAQFLNYLFSNIGFYSKINGGKSVLKIKPRFTTGGLFKLRFGNIVILVCSLGILYPLILARRYRYIAVNLQLMFDVSKVNKVQNGAMFRKMNQLKSGMEMDFDAGFDF